MRDMTSSPAPDIAATGDRPRDRAALGLLLLLALIEFPLIAFVYDPFLIDNSDPAWRAVQSALRAIAPAAVFTLAALAMVLAPERRALAARRDAAMQNHRPRPFLIANLVGFVAMLALTKAFNLFGAGLASPPWALFMLWTAGVGGLYLLLALAAAPLPFWTQSARDYRWHGAAAAGVGGFVLAAARLSQQSWSALSDATFHVSAFFLSLVTDDVISRPAERILGTGDFKVNIAAACSGYEGVGLVLTFLAIYLWVFRKELKFPNAWALLPIGVAAIWTLNSVRIAALILIGEHVSQDVALTGFHSQAGWMMFLIVTIALMLAAHQLSFLRRDDAASRAPAEPSPAYRQALALLAPFLALTSAGILAAAFSAGGEWTYLIRVAAVGAAIVWVAPYLRALDWRAGLEPAMLGLLVGAVWIVTDPARGGEDALGAWLAGMPAGLAALWLFLRVIGTVALVPIAEEFAFRGYLHRKLIADQFETVAEGAFAWKAFLVTSVLFGVLHERWLSAMIAGAVFAIALYRSGKLSGAVVAHMTANAVIAAWAIAAGQWSLL
ncbi:MAG: exosortase E/protease, VPEID-CTERM system [Pseudomonadota bacterium]